jgi:hypothetical protein
MALIFAGRPIVDAFAVRVKARCENVFRILCRLSVLRAVGSAKLPTSPAASMAVTRDAASDLNFGDTSVDIPFAQKKMLRHGMQWIVAFVALSLVVYWLVSRHGTSSFPMPGRGDLIPSLFEARRVTQQRPTDATQVTWAVRTSLDQFSPGR